jgi:hypothetical protein
VEGASFEGISGISGYDYKKAPCVCVEGYNQSFGTHGIMHTFQSTAAPSTPTQSYSSARDSGASAMKKTFPESNCNEECIKAQIDAYHTQNNEINDNTQVNTIRTGRRGPGSADEASRAVAVRSEQARRIRSGQQVLSRTSTRSMR